MERYERVGILAGKGTSIFFTKDSSTRIYRLQNDIFIHLSNGVGNIFCCLTIVPMFYFSNDYIEKKLSNTKVGKNIARIISNFPCLV